MKRQFTALVILTTLLFASGCTELVPQTPANTDSPPSAMIESTDRIRSECLDRSGLGMETHNVPTENGRHLTLNWSYEVPNRSTKLRATVRNRTSGGVPTYELALQTLGNATDCRGRVKYRTELLLQNVSDRYKVVVTLNGDRVGEVTSGNHASGAGSNSDGRETKTES